MKRIILCLLMISLLTGCSPFYNLSNFVIPDDTGFLAVIEKENTPEKFCNYMRENYEWESSPWHSYSPYEMWLLNTRNKTGDCNDMSTSIVFAMDYHGYETYQIWIFYKGTLYTHALGVFVEDNKYTYSSNYNYHPIYANRFRDIALHHCCRFGRELLFYRVYDYDNKLVKD